MVPQQSEQVTLRASGDKACRWNCLGQLWGKPLIPKTDRLQAIEYGIADENLRKLIRKDDNGWNSGDTQQ